MKLNLDELLVKNGISFTIEKLNKLESFKSMVLKENEKINLTSIINDYEFNVKHIIDSLVILNYFKPSLFENKKLIDLGTGAGFPGIPLAIFLTSTTFYLVDSTTKKTTFLEKVVKELNLENVKIINQRAEDVSQDNSFDIGISRGLSSLSTNLELFAGLLNLNAGRLYLYKTPKDAPTQNQQKKSLKEFGFEYYGSINFDLNDEFQRSFIAFNKIKKAKKIYPRKFSLIKTEPVL